jgi:hypothetical protein
MTMKSIFFAVAVAALVGAAIASCPNACSGHGSCGNHDRCSCYANFVGGDCSEKACPYGRSGQECSGRGTCDRGAGSCECADGYSGASCQRTSCPNDCNGKGSCDTTTGMCSCAGGYSGNDCGTRLCPKGDDPLTHEVENSGDGTASQQSEVQTVTFNAGRGLGGTATLTYNDLYGQSWTTRPFNVGGDNVYRLEISIVPDTAVSGDKQKIVFTYNGVSSAALAVTASAYSVATKTINAGKIRNALLPLFGGYQTNPYVGKDRGNTAYVREHYSATSVKLGGSIHANARLTFDIYIPIDMSAHDDNGGLASAFTVAWGATPDANTAELKLYQLGDRSAEIESALTSLPNQVIPSVTVSKVGVTDADTNSDSANGNAYAQSYAITFNNEANSGDQHMLTCNAGSCDESGCINRGPGVSEVRYMHHDPENHGEGINFVNQGYFIMDIGHDTSAVTLSAGSIKIMWDTGAGIDSAVFAIVATAAEVQTALRTITGWEAVTVELWASHEDPSNGAGAQILKNHQFKVTFAAGYDDLGKSPTFYTMQTTDGYAAPSPNANVRARLYDQRFSNSIWLGKVTGYVQLVHSAKSSGELKHTPINAGSAQVAIEALPENGDVWVTSNIYFGTGGTTTAAASAAVTTLPGNAASAAGVSLFKATNAMTNTIDATDLGVQDSAVFVDFAYLKEGKTSVQTSDYFAVGSTVEVLGTTWDDEAVGTDIDAAVGNADSGTATVYNPSSNKYRKFKVTGHVTNEFNREFAKLDSFPADDGITASTANEDKPDYNLKITSNNGTVHTYQNLAAQVTVNEIQVITLHTGQKDVQSATAQIFKLQYKGEETKNMNGLSSAAEIAEEINSFSHLSGPVTVVGEEAGTTATESARFKVTFDAKDGDVAQMVPVNTGSQTVRVDTRANGWSIEGPVTLGLDTMQAGGIVNITAKEVCTFAITGTDNGIYTFCYDGNCGSVTVTTTGANQQAGLESIVDNNGDSVLAGVSATAYAVTMPLGKSCDGLEMVDSQGTAPTVTAIVKTVNKHNNGKLFRITRSFIKSRLTVATYDSGTYDENTISCAAGDCHDAVDNVDSLVISDFNGCDVIDSATTDNPTYPLYRLPGFTHSTGAAATVMQLSTDLLATGPPTAFAAHDGELPDNAGKCSYRIARHVITLDSMPTASATTISKSLEYTSPVGSCSVAETTKGTYESFECSNRGACDGKSGLCTCYEGYSGQSCQTQTVLV